MATVHGIIAEIRAGYPDQISTAMVEEITDLAVRKILSEPEPEANLRYLVRAEVSNLVRANTRQHEQEHARREGYSSPPSGKRQWHPRHEDSETGHQPRSAPTFLDNEVLSPLTGQLIIWGDATRADTEAIAAWRKTRADKLKVSWEFAWQQQMLMTATDAPTLREAYEIDARPIPEEDPDIDLAA